jgi:hypothetical protein
MNKPKEWNKEKVSFSSLKAFDGSPSNYIAHKLRVFEPTPAMIMGSLIHSLILEPTTIDENYIVWEGGRRAGKIWDEFKSVADAEKMEVVKRDEMNDALTIRDAVLNHSVAGDIIRSFRAVEQLIEWNDPDSGVPCRGYLDGMGDGFICDLKSTASNDPDDFVRSCYKEKYSLQASMYLDAANGMMENANQPSEFYPIEDFNDFYIIAFEKSAPFHVMVYVATPTFLAYGNAIKHRLMESFARWDGRPAGREYHTGFDLQPLSTPKFSKAEPYLITPDSMKPDNATSL